MKILISFLLLAISATTSKSSTPHTILIQKKSSKKKLSSQDHKIIEDKIMQENQEEAVALVKQDKLSHLDPFVGDTACHIRALGVAMLHQTLQQQASLDDGQRMFLCLSRLLTKTKMITDPSIENVQASLKSDHTKISAGLSNDRGKKFLKNHQRMLAQMSVELIQREAAKTGDGQLIRALTITKIDSLNRVSCHSYATCKTFLQAALCHKIPLVVKVNRINRAASKHKQLFFWYQPLDNHFSVSVVKDDSINKAVIVIEGLSTQESFSPHRLKALRNHFAQLNLEEFINEFAKLNIFHVLLTCIAAHQPFVSKMNEGVDLPFENLSLTPLKNEIDSYKLAAQDGYAKNSCSGPYIFLATHVSATSFKELLENNEIAQRQEVRRLIKEYFKAIPDAQYQTTLCMYGLSF